MRFRSDAAKLIQFEERGLSGKRGLAGFVLHRKLRRLNDARFEQRCQSRWISLHRNPARAFPSRAGEWSSLHERLFAPHSQLRSRYDLAAVAGDTQETMASSPFQREASHHVGGTPGNHCPRTESRTEGLLSAGLEPGRVAIRFGSPQSRGY